MLDPYRVLEVDSSSNFEEVTKAFKRLRYKYHPDRKSGDRIKYYEVIEAYNKIKNSPKFEYVDVTKLQEEWINSEEEKEHILELYKKYKGKLSKVIENLIFVEDDDEPRIRTIIDKEIEEGRLIKYKMYEKVLKNDKKRQRRKVKESKKAEILAKELGIDINQPLENILNRGRERENKFIEDLELKYCKKLQDKVKRNK